MTVLPDLPVEVFVKFPFPQHFLVVAVAVGHQPVFDGPLRVHQGVPQHLTNGKEVFHIPAPSMFSLRTPRINNNCSIAHGIS